MKPRVWERVYVIVFKWWIMQVLGSLEQCSACYMWIHNLDQVEHVLYFFSRVPKDKVTTQGALQYYLLFFFSNISTYIITRNCCILQYILHIYVWYLSNTKQSVFLWSTSKLRFKKMQWILSLTQFLSLEEFGSFTSGSINISHGPWVLEPGLHLHLHHHVSCVYNNPISQRRKLNRHNRRQGTSVTWSPPIGRRTFPPLNLIKCIWS